MSDQGAVEKRLYQSPLHMTSLVLRTGYSWVVLAAMTQALMQSDVEVLVEHKHHSGALFQRNGFAAIEPFRRRLSAAFCDPSPGDCAPSSLECRQLNFAIDLQKTDWAPSLHCALCFPDVGRFSIRHHFDHVLR